MIRVPEQAADFGSLPDVMKELDFALVGGDGSRSHNRGNKFSRTGTDIGNQLHQIRSSSSVPHSIHFEFKLRFKWGSNSIRGLEERTQENPSFISRRPLLRHCWPLKQIMPSHDIRGPN